MHKKLYLKAVIAFSIAFILCAVLVTISIANRIAVERFEMEQLIINKSTKASEVVMRLLYKTHTLSAFIRQGMDGEESFEMIAATIIDDPSILNVLIAPNGIVSEVYPLEGNEAVLGLDFFAEGAGNKEARMAAESGELVFGGPFDLVQGGQALVGRLPVYITDPKTNEDRFWGIVSITLKYPEVLDTVGFRELQLQGFAYEIWRINPDNNERQIITSSGYKYNKDVHYIEKHIPMQNADWYFRILPVRSWYEYPETWMMIIASVCISILVGYVMQSNGELTVLKAKFESLSQTDPLTGILNRRYFLERAAAHCERSKRLNNACHIVFFDIDNFKKINDQYGHSVGDKVLDEFAFRVKRVVRPYDLFGRYGGEEFILLVSDIEKNDMENFVERIRLNIFDQPFSIDDNSICVSASFGMAPVAPESSLEDAVRDADVALYIAKNDGRNRSVYIENGQPERLYKI